MLSGCLKNSKISPIKVFYIHKMTIHKILFVCLGNICRSPMAEYLFRHIAAERGLKTKVASAGTSGWHDGEGMHCGTADILDGLNIDSHHFISRRVQDQDFDYYDYILVMDNQNLHDMEQRFGQHPTKLFKITDLLPHSTHAFIPDPWYTHNFNETRDLLTQCCHALADKLQQLS